MARLKRDGLLTSVTHIANQERSRASLSYNITRYLEASCGLEPVKAAAEMNKTLRLIVASEWASLASVTGTRLQVKAALHEISGRMLRFGHTKVITEKLLNIGFNIADGLRFLPYGRRCAAAISAMRPLHKLALGVPTDVVIENLLWKYGHPNRQAAELDSSSCGLLFVNPALPLDGKIVQETIENMKAIAKHYQHMLYITINIETDTSLVAIVNLLFDRSDIEESKKAHQCADALLSYLHKNKLEVYRARADMMAAITANDPEYWRTIYSLKQIFDPDNIIAPGRYNLP